MRFYVRGSWMFFKRMWPALYDLSTSEVYVYASSIAFNILLSFFPFIVLVGSVLVNLLNSQESYETIYKLMRAFVPVESGMLFRSLDSVTRGPTGKAGLFSFGLLIFSSSGVFLPIELALNRAYGFIKPRGTIKQYLTYFALTIICGGIMIGAAMLTSYVDLALAAAFGTGQVRLWFFNGLALLISLPFMTLFLFLIYYWVPHGKVEVRQIFFTSFATGLLCLIATFAYRLALPLLGFQSSYGEIFKVMALVTWVFILSFILILGANLSARQVLPRFWTGRQPRHAPQTTDDGIDQETNPPWSPQITQ
ncbi:MAG: YihY/virulence factor BrkB family protein [Acidobacteriota bacterium]